MSAPFTLVFHETGYQKDLLASIPEPLARNFARSESAVLRNVVSLWRGADHIATYDNGED